MVCLTSEYKENKLIFLLEQGVKGLVVCTISCAEEKGKNDLQAAIHALRCIIGPRAQLVCTTMVEPSLKQGVVLATILFTRYLLQKVRGVLFSCHTRNFRRSFIDDQE
jgi:hypothetical protein